MHSQSSIHAIEQNDAKVHSISTEPVDKVEGTIHVTIKLNTLDAARVRHILEHHGYKITAAYGASEDSDLSGRIQEFMRYLEV